MVKAINNIYIVEVTLNTTDKYYLSDFDYSLTKNIRNSLIFVNENNAYKFASIIETIYENSLGKVKKEEIKKIFF